MSIIKAHELERLTSEIIKDYRDKRKDELEEQYRAYFKSIYEEMKSKAKDGKREWSTKFLTYKMANDVAEYFKLCDLKVSVYSPDSRDDDEIGYTLVVNW